MMAKLTLRTNMQSKLIITVSAGALEPGMMRKNGLKGKEWSEMKEEAHGS
jgi:hypothetical protein